MATIFDLIDAGDADGVRRLLAQDPGAAAQKDEQGLTVVMRAAYRGMTDPNAVATASFARVTPLGTCSFAGSLDVAKVLLEHGADPRIGEDGEYTAEAEAIARGNEELAALIRQHTA
jgi:ankyrin repeat protein